MPTTRIPLIGVTNPRGIDGSAVLAAGKDQQFTNVTFDLVRNPVTQKSVAYVERRPGWRQHQVVSAGNIATGLIMTDLFGTIVSAFGTPNSSIFDSTTNVGTITGEALHFTETTVNSVGCILIRSSDGTGWYYMAGARNVTAYTCDGNNSTTITDIKVAGANSTSGLYPGQKLTAATNIPAGARIVSVDSGAFTAVIDQATTGGSFNDLAVTKEPIAKITSGYFVTTGNNISAFVCMDGYTFYCTEDGYVYHSDINSVTSWSASSKIAANASPDLPVAIAKQASKILCLGNSSIEPFENAGNPSGSVLSRFGYPKNTGSQNQRSVAYLGDDIYFVSSTRTGDVSVKRMRGLQIDAISSPQVNKILGTASALGSSIFLSAFTLSGYSYLLASAIALSAIPLASEDDYSILMETGDTLLTEVQSSSVVACQLCNLDLGNMWSALDSSLPTFVIGTGESSLNHLVCASRISTSGKTYTINPSSDGEIWQDDGTTYDCVIRTAEIDHGTDSRKFIGRISLIADTEEAGTVLLEANDDGYDPTKWYTIGTFDLTEARKDIHRCGSYIGGRSYRLTHNCNGPLRASALDIEYKVGT